MLIELVITDLSDILSKQLEFRIKCCLLQIGIGCGIFQEYQQQIFSFDKIKLIYISWKYKGSYFKEDKLLRNTKIDAWFFTYLSFSPAFFDLCMVQL